MHQPEETLINVPEPDWPGQVLSKAFGFKSARGQVEVILGYAVCERAVRLEAYIRMGTNEPSLWRGFWVSYIEALTSAEELCADAEEYLEQYNNVPPRPCEDLDFYDFLQHMEMRINNELH